MLCLDFDGVICNSIDECLLVAYNSYMKIESRVEEQVAKPESISKSISEKFRKYRYLVRPAKDYWILVNLILKCNDVLTKEEFQLEKVGNENKLNEFEKIFFDSRRELQENHFNFWIGMNKIYDSFIEAWESISLKYDVYIVTNKNKNAVDAILRHYNINIHEDHLYTKEIFNTKTIALEEIVHIEKITNEDVIFIDDSPDTIAEALEKFPKSFLANWGYYENKNGIQSINSLMELV
jgi:FMN phosphatase YigB (HAD superfamily)